MIRTEGAEGAVLKDSPSNCSVSSTADTVKMPSASSSNDTRILGVPRGAGLIPVNSNEPSLRLSAVAARSPSNTLIVTDV